jgi:hypothetical protein
MICQVPGFGVGHESDAQACWNFSEDYRMIFLSMMLPFPDESTGEIYYPDEKGLK